MKKIYTFVFATAALFGASNANAQCPAGEVNVTIDVTTDDWGYECFWDLTPTGNGCGVGAIFTGGNAAEVGCAGGGLQDATAGGYANNTTTTETIGCLVIGDCFDINFVDDWGDGGTTFDVFFDGILDQSFTAPSGTSEAAYSFCVASAAINDVDMVASPYEYTRIPLAQVGNIVGQGESTGVLKAQRVVLAGTVLEPGHQFPCASWVVAEGQGVGL
jgi:hypothetical protein